MTTEQLQALYETYEDKHTSGVKNAELKGLQILAKYSDDVSVTAEHDQIWAYLKDWTPLTEEDARAMFELNWMWEEENEGFSKFV